MFGFFKKKKYRFEIDAVNRIVNIRSFGEIFTTDILQMTQEMLSFQTNSDKYNFILDVSSSKELFGHNQLGSVANCFHQHRDKLKDVKLAVIIGNPKQSKMIDAFLNTLEASNIQLSLKKVIDRNQAVKWIQKP